MAALDRLATALGRSEFSTTLVTGGARRPCLTVTSRRTAVAENMYADGDRYWWGWGEPIAATEDPLTAAYHVSTALRGIAPQQEQR